VQAYILIVRVCVRLYIYIYIYSKARTARCPGAGEKNIKNRLCRRRRWPKVFIPIRVLHVCASIILFSIARVLRSYLLWRNCEEVKLEEESVYEPLNNRSSGPKKTYPAQCRGAGLGGSKYGPSMVEGTIKILYLDIFL